MVFWRVTCCRNWRQLNPHLLCFLCTTTSTLLILNPLRCPTYHPCIVSSSVLRRAISLISALLSAPLAQWCCCLSRIHAFWSSRIHPVNTALNIDRGITHKFLFIYFECVCVCVCFAVLGLMCTVQGFFFFFFPANETLEVLRVVSTTIKASRLQIIEISDAWEEIFFYFFILMISEEGGAGDTSSGGVTLHITGLEMSRYVDDSLKMSPKSSQLPQHVPKITPTRFDNDILPQTSS